MRRPVYARVFVFSMCVGVCLCTHVHVSMFMCVSVYIHIHRDIPVACMQDMLVILNVLLTESQSKYAEGEMA